VKLRRGVEGIDEARGCGRCINWTHVSKSGHWRPCTLLECPRQLPQVHPSSTGTQSPRWEFGFQRLSFAALMPLIALACMFVVLFDAAPASAGVAASVTRCVAYPGRADNNVALRSSRCCTPRSHDSISSIHGYGCVIAAFLAEFISEERRALRYPAL